MSTPHWNYLLSVEDDLAELARFVELVPANYATYSIELARLLMAATQDVDVLLKQICTAKGGAADKEAGYRSFIPTAYPHFTSATVQLPRHSLSFVPFADWTSNTTPKWWTANNKVKHERHTHFAKASLENTLNAISALLVANLYFHDATSTLDELFPATKHLYPKGMIPSVSPTAFGLVPRYKVL